MASGAEIAALSWQSDGPLGSGWQGPKASVGIERLVAMQPEMLLLGPGESVDETLLPDTRIVSLEWAEDWQGVQRNVSGISEGVGEGRSKVEQIGDRPAETGRPRVLYLSRAGGTAGPGTYVDEAIRLAGGANIVSEPGWFTPDPEWVVAQEPDVIVTSFFDAYESVNAPAVRNRAVARFIADHPRIDVPGRMWPCAGPGLTHVVETISENLP